MDLIILLSVSIFIMGLVIAYTYFAGFGTRIQFGNAQAAKTYLENANPHSALTQHFLSSDNSAALGIYDDGSASLAYPMGHNWVSKPLYANTVRTAAHSASHQLRLTFKDFTAPNLRIALDTPQDMSAWQAALAPYLFAKPST